MSTERFEWLDLSSSPLETAAKKKTQESTEETALCPQCRWPVDDTGEVCSHCGYSAAKPVAKSGAKGTPPAATPPVKDFDGLVDLDIALPDRMVEITPPPMTWFKGKPLDTPTMYDLRLQAERLQVRAGFDRLICLDDINVDHYEHQLEAALRVLRDMRGRALLADEVGLGKTIEAGIVMKELIERGLARSIIILTPASLTWQWHEEMQTKFHEDFQVLERLKHLPKAGAEADPSQPMQSQAHYCRWIISLDRAKSPRWAERLLAFDYDLLIVDEAHKLKNHRTQIYRFVNQIRKNYVLMLTATPVHNDLMELYNLITILHPGHLGTRRAFRQNFVQAAARQHRAARRTIYSQKRRYGLNYLRKSAAQRRTYRQIENADWIVERTEDFADFSSLSHLTDEGQKAAEEVKALLAQGYEVFDFEAVTRRRPGWVRVSATWLPGGLQTDFVCRLKVKSEGASARSQKAQKRQIKERTTPRNAIALRGLLREVMIRNRRTSVGVRFPPREAAVYYLNFTPPERDLYDGVTAYIRQQLRQAQESNSGGHTSNQTGQKSRSSRRSVGALRLAMMTLQKELCSSPQAVANTLTRRIARDEKDKKDEDEAKLIAYLVLAQSIKVGRKVTATLDILAQYPGKFLIFTEYTATLQTLQAALLQAGHETVVFHGGLSAHERVEIVRTFRRSARVMISTHSGGEGHNLQFCHQMINFDLPWNPMRIEQRIGRIHRLGQKQAVTIFNLTAIDTIEAYVLDLLAHKIRMFELVIGELDLILGELGQNRSFEDHISAAWSGSQSEAELLQKITALEEIIAGAFDNYQTIRTTSDALSDLIDEEMEERGG